MVRARPAAVQIVQSIRRAVSLLPVLAGGRVLLRFGWGFGVTVVFVILSCHPRRWGLKRGEAAVRRKMGIPARGMRRGRWRAVHLAVVRVHRGVCPLGVWMVWIRVRCLPMVRPRAAVVRVS